VAVRATNEVSSHEAGVAAPVVDVSEDSHIGPRLTVDMRTPCPRACLECFDEFLEARKAPRAHREHVLATLAEVRLLAPQMPSETAIEVYRPDRKALSKVADRIVRTTLSPAVTFGDHPHCTQRTGWDL
jgi:hypothetical protein